MKPITKILIILGIVIIVGLGIYLSWKKITGPSGGGAASTSTPSTNNPSAASPLKQISEEKVFDFWTDKDTGEIYYITPTGKIMGAKDGPDPEISSQTLDALNFIEVAPGDKKILAAFGSPHAPNWGIFDLIDKVWRPLPAEIVNATWGTKDSELIGIVKNGNDLNLARVDLAKTPPTYKILIKDFRFKDVKLTFRNPETLIISEKPSAFYAGRVWNLDLKKLNLAALLRLEKGLTIKWTKDKSIAFKFSSSNGLFFSDGGFLKKQLQAVFLTLPEKCGGEANVAASSSLVYCFVPQQGFPQKSNLPDDYYQNKFFSVDDLFVLKIDAVKNEIAEIKNPLMSRFNGAPAIDGLNPQVLNNSLYFVNRYDNYLYEFKLEK